MRTRTYVMLGALVGVVLTGTGQTHPVGTGAAVPTNRASTTAPAAGTGAAGHSAATASLPAQSSAYCDGTTDDYGAVPYSGCCHGARLVWVRPDTPITRQRAAKDCVWLENSVNTIMSAIPGSHG